MNRDPEAWKRLARALRQAREHAELTQTELAKRANVSVISVQSAERGTVPKRRMPYTLPRIAKALGWPPDAIRDILEGGNRKEPRSHAQSDAAPPGDHDDARVRALDALWETLTPEERRQQLRRLQKAEEQTDEPRPYADLSDSRERFIWEMDLSEGDRRTLIDNLRAARAEERRRRA